MKYDYNNNNRDKYLYDDIKLAIEAEKWNKNSGKEVLQYAVGSLLYMPASNTKIASKIISKEYEFIKAMVLDLEDSLGDDLVGFGQRSIVTTINEIAEAVESNRITIDDIPLIFIRVRESKHIIDTKEMLQDNIKYITGFNIPKFDKDTCDSFIEAFKYVSKFAYDKFNTCLYIMPIIENKNTMYRQLRMENI